MKKVLQFSLATSQFCITAREHSSFARAVYKALPVVLLNLLLLSIFKGQTNKCGVCSIPTQSLSASHCAVSNYISSDHKVPKCCSVQLLNLEDVVYSLNISEKNIKLK